MSEEIRPMATLETFWDFVAQVNWSTQNCDYAALQREIMERYTWPEIHPISNRRQDLWNEMYAHLSNWEGRHQEDFELGDDGFGDLINHIIGRGQGKYQQVMKDPAVALDMARSRSFKESFSYCIPYEMDWDKGKDRWKKKDPGHYAKRADESLGEYREALTQVSTIQHHLKAVVEALDLVATQPHKALEKGIDPNAQKALQYIDRDEKMKRAMQTIRNPWPVLNLFSDLDEYMDPVRTHTKSKWTRPTKEGWPDGPTARLAEEIATRAEKK